MATYVVIWFTCLLACCLSATTNDGNSKPETSKDPCSNQTIPACVNATSDALKKDLCSLLNYHVRQYCYKAGAPFSFADKTNATYLTEENVCQQINSSRKFVKGYPHQNVWNNTECTQFCSSSKELCNSWITLIKKLYTIGTDGNKSESNDTSGNSSKHTIGTDGNKSKSNDTSGNSSKLPNEADGNDKRKLKDSNVTNVNTSNSKPEDSLPPSNGVNVMKSKPSNSSASRTGASSTGASSTGTSSTGASSTGTSSTGASSTGTSSTGASSTGTSSTGASSTGTSSTGASRTGTSSTGASSTGTSSTGASSTGTSSTGASSTVAPNSAVPNSGASNSKTGDSSQDTKNLNSKQREFTEAPSSAHFMGYFLTAIILCITGYVLFHNKQKIIAFIIEGRHRKRGRRPNSGEYRKLQTQVDDVMHSLDKSTSSQNYIY